MKALSREIKTGKQCFPAPADDRNAKPLRPFDGAVFGGAPGMGDNLVMKVHCGHGSRKR